MANEIKQGDVVSLMSGGPSMTVTNIAKDYPSLAYVAWFDGFDLKTTTINAAALKLVQRDDEDTDATE